MVIAGGDQMDAMHNCDAMHNDTERRCVTLLALQAPVAADLRVVIAALHASGHLKRMGSLAWHIAVIARLKHPNPMIAGEVRPVLARMGLLASQLAEDAATAIEHHDPLSGCRLAVSDDEVDALRRHLFGILFAEDWAHGVERAVDAALIGRYYERSATTRCPSPSRSATWRSVGCPSPLLYGRPATQLLARHDRRREHSLSAAEDGF